MVRMEVGDGDDLQRAIAQAGSFPPQLSALAGIEKIEGAVHPHGQGSQQSIGHGHHSARSEQYAFHDVLSSFLRLVVDEE
jgi:hypothetical protein